MTTGLNSLTAHELSAFLDKGDITPRDIYNSLIEAIKEREPGVSALAHFDEEAFLKRCLCTTATERKHPLWGIPVFIKDNICVEGELTTCCSRILRGFIPPYSATVVERLSAGGLVPAGKTNMDEFAFGSSTETSCYGPTHNPWDTERSPGGSSGGSAAAVAADEAIFALGSDTGGSIRQPASLCGIVGLKPTYGRVSRYGLIAFASSLDQIGTLTKDVEDAALLLTVISGHDSKDSTSADIPVPDYRRGIKEGIKGLRVAVPREYFGEGIDPEVKEAVLNAIKKIESLGAICENASLPHTEYAVAVYYILATAEASSNLARYDGVQYGFRAGDTKDLIETYKKTRGAGFGEEAKRRILLGTFALSSGYYDAYYMRALKVRTLIKNDFDKLFKKFDAVVTPTSPTPAFKLGEKIKDPLTMYLSDIYTISANLAGIPGISVPCGFTKDNLPVGLQILGRPFDEHTILKIAYNYEQASPWRAKRPFTQGGVE